MKQSHALAVAALTSITWGLTGIFVRLLPTLSALTLTSTRLLIALAATLPFLLLRRAMRRALRAALTQPVAYLLATLLAGYYLLATAAFQLAPVAEAALLLNTPPLFVIALRYAQGQRPVRAEIGGVVLALAGMALILAPKILLSATPASTANASGQGGNELYGHFCALGAAALSALYATIYRALAGENRAPDAGAQALLTFAVGSALLLLAFAVQPGVTPTGIAALDARGVWLLLALALVSTAIPTLGFAQAAKHLPPIVTSLISLFIPLFAAIFAVLILGETISRLFLIGALLVLGGAALIIRQSRTAGARRPLPR